MKKKTNKKFSIEWNVRYAPEIQFWNSFTTNVYFLLLSACRVTLKQSKQSILLSQTSYNN